MGMLAVAERHEHAFSDGDVRLLETLAASISVALDNARLFDETQRLLKETEQRNAELAVIASVQQGIAAELDLQAIIDLVGDKLREVFATGDIGIWWWDAEKRATHGLYVYEHGVRHQHAPIVLPAGDPLERVVDHRETLHVNNRAESLAIGLHAIEGTDQSLSALIMPIVGGDRVLGSVVLEDYERENAFGPDAVRLLGTVVAAMGTALENARLFDETQQALERQTATAEVLQVIGSSMADPKPVFEKIVECFERLFDARAFAVAIVDDASQVLLPVLRMTASARDEIGADKADAIVASTRAAFPRPLAGSLTERAIRKGDLVAVSDLHDDPDHSQPAARAAREVGLGTSVVVAPTMWQGRGIGLLAMFRKDSRGLQGRENALLKSFADQAVIAIQNARLFNDTQEALEQQRAAVGSTGCHQQFGGPDQPGIRSDTCGVPTAL